MSFDPFAVSSHLRANFIRYLIESHPIHGQEATLQEQFERELQVDDRFVREPLVSAIPTYVHDRPVRDLLGRQEAPRLDPQLASMAGFDIDRPLYRHQVRAIERIEKGRNVVVATGTGSGKTECFLMPILDAAARARIAGHSGVLAILVYPMNALANDQLGRMREMIGSTTAITFGRYTSQTPHKLGDLNEEQRREAIKYPNELATREQIQSEPPQILLTNFAMLEYLLLRPKDQDIFRQPSLRFVVLDEAHAYSGSQGIDIGLLMRRLRQRYQQAPQFILTSATLGSPGEEQQIAEFAAKLTGVVYEKEDVVTGDVADPFHRTQLTDATPTVVKRLAAAGNVEAIQSSADDVVAVREWLSGCGIAPQTGKSGGEILYHTLCRLRPAAALYDALVGKAKTVAELAEEVFGPSTTAEEAEQGAAVRTLLTAAAFARPAGKYSSPLLTVRLHHFFRGLSGASVLLSPSSDRRGRRSVRVDQLVLEDVRQDPATGRRLLPLRTCIHCGMPAVTIRRDGNGWEPGRPIRNSSGGLQLLTWLDPSTLDGSDGEGQGDADEPDASPMGEADIELCLSCGGLGDGEETSCDCDVDAKVRLRPIKGGDDDGNLSTCPCCSGAARPAPSVLRDFRTGEDAPTAVLAEEMVRRMPVEPGRQDLPAGGRQLLAFSDSRQRAAFFMPYLTRTTAEPAYIHPLLQAARELEEREGEPADVLSVVDRAHRKVLELPWTVLRRTDESDGFERYEIKPTPQLTSNERKAMRRELALTAYAQITSPNTHRTKLGGLMLAAPEVELTGAECAAAAKAVPALFADEQVGRDALQRMLLSVVRRYAVRFEPEEISPRHFMNQGPAMVTLHRAGEVGRAPGSPRSRIRWNPYEAPTKSRKRAVAVSYTATVVRQVLGTTADDTSVARILDDLWGWLTDRTNGVLVETKHSGEFQLPAGRLRLRVTGRWHRCERCGASSIHPMDGICEARGCGAKLLALSDEDRQRRLDASNRAFRYSRDPLPLVVREHTAQLTLESGRKYQEQFKRGEVNVLSSSTTFEMGVDVGQLQAVLLRNVPPTPANYIQRAGRAGRRQQGVAHAVTFARTVPHDQHHYFAPRDIVVGRVPVPVIYTANRVLTQRHVNSLLLGRFLREQFSAHTEANLFVADFFPVADGEDKPATRYGKWCQDQAVTLTTAVAAIIPGDCDLDASAAVLSSARTLYSPDSTRIDTAYHRGLRLPLKSYEAQEADLKKLLTEAFQANQFDKVKGLGGAVMRVQALRNQLFEQHLIDFLSSEHWLPAYAFPQDVVKLTVRQVQVSGSMRLERDREVGISEYSPGSEVIADGKLFESVGVNLERGQPELMYFRSDPRTRRVAIGWTEQEVNDATPGVDRAALQFLEPMGFTTQWDAEAAEPNLYRLRPPSSSEVFLRDGAEQFIAHPHLPGVLTGIKNDATLFRANLGRNGKGFRICLYCGRGLELADLKKGVHPKPYGGECRGRGVLLALAHTFNTNVLQVRFPGYTSTPGLENRPFWLTLSTAFAIAACRTLNIAASDLDSTYQGTTEGGKDGELILYDRVPGGAGHVGRIDLHLPDVLRRTYDLLEGCDNQRCDITSSCYACLRSHKNQFDWSDLDRSAPLAWLTTVAGKAQSR